MSENEENEENEEKVETPEEIVKSGKVMPKILHPSRYKTKEDVINDDSLTQNEKDYLLQIVDKKSRKYKWGRISDEEARFIERNLPLSSYKDIAIQLQRRPETIRRWAQKNGISVDKISRKKSVLEDIKRDKFFQQLDSMLTEDEIVLSHSIYLEMCEQFGNDIKYSERQEIIDFCIVTCLLNRELKKEKVLEDKIYKSEKEKVAIKAKKDSIGDDEDDLEEEWLEQIDEVDMLLADLKDERKETKIRQDKLMDRKDKAMKAMDASRTQRSDQLTHSTKNFGALVEYLQKNVDYRRQVGYEMEKMNLGINAEWNRLATLYEYADGSFDYPILSSEVVAKELEQEKNEK